jgi:hypothetical protein
MTTDKEDFYERLADAPYGARGFFETVGQHFERRNDVRVHYTATNTADMRLEAYWPKDNGQEGKQNFATMYWQTKNLRVSARCYLAPDELSALGFEGATEPKAEKEPLNSDISLDESAWRFRAQDFIRAMEAARIKLLQAKADAV